MSAEIHSCSQRQSYSRPPPPLTPTPTWRRRTMIRASWACARIGRVRCPARAPVQEEADRVGEDCSDRGQNSKQARARWREGNGRGL
eukprot:64254-Pleurochrysis_carterae.AAC.1